MSTHADNLAHLSRILAPVSGPDGRHLTIDDLPPVNTRRWVTRRKAEVVAAVRGGLLSLEEACARYKLSEEEFRGWERLIDAHGVRGLRVTRLKDYRLEPDLSLALVVPSELRVDQAGTAD